MRTYIGVVHKDPESAYGIHFPDVPGCFSASDTLNGLLAEAAEALALHLEDIPPPAVRSVDEVRADPEVQEDLAGGAFLMAVPHISMTGRTAKANITMDAGLLRAVDVVAKARGVTRSAFLSDLARREIIG